ncbi:hypothetical protein PSTT_16757, partial [Puccinia striiformis]
LMSHVADDPFHFLMVPVLGADSNICPPCVIYHTQSYFAAIDHYGTLTSFSIQSIWVNEEIPLMSKFFGVKCMVPPGPFPFNTLQIMRFLRVVKENDQARLLEAITDRLYEVIFENKVPVSKDMSEVFKSLSPDLMERARVEEYLSQSGDEKIKESVKQDAEQVVEEGGFGFPWLEITQPNGQQLTIFGSDRFEFLANWLGKEWKGPNPSVSNPRESRL